MSARAVVLDASIGVKWFRNEAGSTEARELLADHINGTTLIAVDSLFLYEVLCASSREGSESDCARVWSDLAAFELVVVPLGGELVAAAAAARVQLGCTLYDAFAAGLADLLDAPLYSADSRAHGAHPRVRIVGGSG